MPGDFACCIGFVCHSSDYPYKCRSSVWAAYREDSCPAQTFCCPETGHSQAGAKGESGQPAQHVLAAGSWHCLCTTVAVQKPQECQGLHLRLLAQAICGCTCSSPILSLPGLAEVAIRHFVCLLHQVYVRQRASEVHQQRGAWPSLPFSFFFYFSECC